MTRKKDSEFLRWFCSLAAFLIFCLGASFAQAFTLGKTYEKGNWQEIDGMLPPSVLNWVKKGEWIIQTANLDYADELGLDPKYADASLKNDGKYEINEEGLLVSKKTGEPEFIFGNPFPVLDPKDPKIAEEVMENFKFTMHYRMGGSQSSGIIKWVGTKGFERQIEAPEYLLYYWNRPRGPIPNPNKFLEQTIHYVAAPMDLRGTVTMTWLYIDDKVGTGFAYIPMLRRVRRISVAARSDPFAGSDMTVDDSRGWGGKNASVKMKLTAQGTFLAPFASVKKSDLYIEQPDGSILRGKMVSIKKGYEVPGWSGVAWAAVNLKWYPRPMWVIEAIPKDRYYNFGKLVFYVDQENYVLYFKPMYSWSGEYWKTFLYASRLSNTQNGQRWIGDHVYYSTIDDKSQHSSVAEPASAGVAESMKELLNMPITDLGSAHFTETYLRQLSK